MQDQINQFNLTGFSKISKNDSFSDYLFKLKDEIVSIFPEYETKEAPKKWSKQFGRAIDQRLDDILPSELVNDNPLYGKRFVMDVLDFPKNILSIVEHEHILNTAKKMLNTDKVVLHNGSLSAVYPGHTGNESMYHSDTVNFCNKNQTLKLLDENKYVVNIMILFDNVDENLAPMKILEKTHKISLHKKINNYVSLKLKESNKFDNLSQDNWIYKELLEDFDLNEATFTGNYGDVGAMNSFALHQASPNFTSNKTRRAMILNFGREVDNEFLRKYPFSKSKLFVSKLINKEIANNTYTKNSSILFKLKWKFEDNFKHLTDLSNRQIRRVKNPAFVISRILYNFYLIFSIIVKQKRNFLNIGGGALFKHPKFYNFDVRDDIEYDRSKGLIKFDLSKNDSMPFDSSSLEGIYSSHCLEHLTDKQAEGILKESYRILNNDKPLRIVLPDMKRMFDAYDNRDASFFYNIRVKQNRPDFLWIHDTWLRLITRSFAGHVVDEYGNEELEDMYNKFNREDFISKVLEKEKTIPDYRFVPNCHKSYWEYDKLKKILLDIGFSKVFISKPGMSKNRILRNRTLFDVTQPENSFIIEAYK
jgi:predicted SAM-dependent methyltransferase